MQYLTAADIINQAAAEVGLSPVADPYSSTDEGFSQLTYLLNTTGQILLWANASGGGWEKLQREHTFTIDSQQDPQTYPLPDDFAYMIDQTGWMRTQNVPLAGPLSPQDWQYLEGRNLLSSTIYASFRLWEGLLHIFAQGQLLDEEIAYEYISNRWVKPSGAGQNDFANFKTRPDTGSDIILFPDPLPVLALKSRYLAAKGFDTTKADDEFSQMFLAISGVDKSAPKLNMARHYLGYPYLDAWRNLPDTGYGNKPIMG